MKAPSCMHIVWPSVHLISEMFQPRNKAALAQRGSRLTGLYARGTFLRTEVSFKGEDEEWNNVMNSCFELMDSV